MTEEQIKQNAEQYAEAHMVRTDGGGWEEEYDYEEQKAAYIAGAHSRDEEISELNARIVKLMCERDSANSEMEYLIEQSRNQWISVKDRLPEDDDLVLTIYWVHKDFYSIELSSYNHETREWDCGEFGYRISHWMPIPKLKE